MKRAKLATIAGFIVCATTISACASDEATRTYSARQGVEQFAGIDFDYDPVVSPAALAPRSSLVVTGTIDRVQEGRVDRKSTRLNSSHWE